MSSTVNRHEPCKLLEFFTRTNLANELGYISYHPKTFSGIQLRLQKNKRNMKQLGVDFKWWLLVLP